MVKQNRKPKITDKVVWISLGLIAFFVFQDLLGYAMWNSVGGYPGEAYASVGMMYFTQFWLFAYASIAVVAFTYHLIKKDWSETLALITTPVIMLWFGLHDLLYWVFGNVTWTLADGYYLYNHMPVVALFADILGTGTINVLTLFVSTLAGAILAYIVYKWLLKQKW